MRNISSPQNYLEIFRDSQIWEIRNRRLLHLGIEVQFRRDMILQIMKSIGILGFRVLGCS